MTDTTNTPTPEMDAFERDIIACVPETLHQLQAYARKGRELETRLAAALSELQAWQPMETAPRDGTPFLAYIEFENRGKPDWEINIVALDPEYIEPVMDADYEDGWEFEHYDAWMPLPTPPMKEGE